MTPLQSRMMEAYQKNPLIGRKKLMREAQVSAGAAQRFLERQRGKLKKPPQDAPPDNDNITVDYSTDKAHISTSSTKITNLEQALAAAKVDLSKWEVDRHTVNWWDVTFKTESGPQTVTNFQIKVWLKRKTVCVIREALSELTTEIVGKGPTKTFIPVIRSNDPHMLEISIFDLHFGKLAWAAETGTDYDIKIAGGLFRDAIRTLLGNVRSFDINKILLPIGSDFLHINGENNMTANNTPQDVDTRLVKIYKTACRVVVEAISDCATVAPVEVLYVPGNHDKLTSFYLCSYLEAWYSRHEAVSVDVSPKARKYCRYGTNLVGFTHGDEEKTNDLPLLMAGECGTDWAAVTHREWHIGHLHKSKEMKFVAGDTHGPVVVRILPSLSGTDAWHYRKGYCGGRRAAEAYLWSYHHGYTGHFSANVAEAQ